MAFALLLALTGCVERKMMLKSDPPDVAIYMDGRLEGRTDAKTSVLEIPFDWYGTRKIVARKAGYVPTRMTVHLDPPWWQIFPFDLFSDLLFPGTLEDVQHPDVVVLERRKDIRSAEDVEADARQFKAGEERRPR